MYKAELQLEKRLNDLALANVPSSSYENIVIVPKRKQEVVLQMSPDEFDLRDLAYDQKMNVISKNAIVDRLGWKPSKIKSDVTKEMIQDYQLEQMKNIKKGVYIPSSLDLDLLEEPKERPVLTDRQLARFQTELRRVTREIDEVQTLQKDSPSFYDALMEEWERQQQEALLAADAEPNALQRAVLKKRIRIDAQNALDLLNARFENYKAELQKQDADTQAEYLALLRVLKENETNRLEYQKEKAEVAQENAKRRKRYEDLVLSMNMGINNIAMLPNETEDEYKQRLADIGDSTYDEDAVEQAASLLYTDRLREKMAEITRNDVIVGDFIRRLNTDQRYSMVKVFETFKKKVLEIFGQDNKLMSADDLYNIAYEMADRVAIKEANVPDLFKEELDENPFRAVSIQEGSAVTSARAPYVFSKGLAKAIPSRMEDLARYVEDIPLPVYQKPLGDFNQRRFLAEIARIDAWREGKPLPQGIGGVQPRPRPSDSRYVIVPSIGQLKEELRTARSQMADQDEVDKIDVLLGLNDMADLLKEAKRQDFIFEFQAPQQGRGLHPKYPKILRFGLIELSPHKLFYENTLKITRKGKHLTGFPNVKVSDAFVKFMFKIMDGGQPTMKEVNALSAGEKALFDSVIFTAGLAREVETTGSGVKQDLKNRLALIEGEIEAGNTNPELIKEARKILQHLARMKIIGHRPATEHLKMLIRAQRA